MKRILPTTLCSILGFSAFAQLPVSQTPENRNAVLEEFTGIHCGFCPDGHRIGSEIHDANPNDVILVNIHTGSYANPGAGEIDLRTDFGSAIADQTGLQGYPAGTVNRHVFSGGVTAMSRGDWSQSVDQILAMPSYVNVALEAEVDAQTREMTVNVEVYYTDPSAVPAALNNENKLNVVLLQNNIEGTQSGASMNSDAILTKWKL